MHVPPAPGPRPKPAALPDFGQLTSTRIGWSRPDDLPPAKKSMSISTSPRNAFRIALFILRQVIRHPRSNVSFEIGES